MNLKVEAIAKNETMRHEHITPDYSYLICLKELRKLSGYVLI